MPKRILVCCGTSIALVALLCVVGPFSDSDRALASPPRGASGPGTVVAWNDLGMHCLDPDFSLFSMLPPYNTVNAHLILNGRLQTAASGYTLTFEGVADPNGSINTTSVGKTNFWDHEDDLFGVDLPPDTGLTGSSMPGPANLPQPMGFDGTWNWFDAIGVPFTPYDDALAKNPYPLIRVRAFDSAGTEVGSTITTAPNSAELSCSQCHASAGSPFARPDSGWEFSPDPVRDDRFNILRLHDDRELGNPEYVAALATAGYRPEGLYATAVTYETAILCDRCHGSNALPGTGIAGVKPMTEAIHSFHAGAVTPNGVPLDANPTRVSCYTCHPGNDTKCMRGAMGKAIGSDGGFSMQCQSCHQGMAQVGEPGRAGWFDEPTCQNCHTGTATDNNGQIRYATAFESDGSRRIAVNSTFATEPDVPAPGVSLYRFSSGHGGLQCSTCHGSPHAIYPTSEANDNLQSMMLQGHVGTITDCNACHAGLEDDELDQGPHGMHSVSSAWANGKHGDHAEHDLGQCRSCHGSDLRGTVLSLAQGDRSYATRYGTKTFFRGSRISCWACHEGPSSDDRNNNVPPVVPNVSLNTPNDQPVSLTLGGSDSDGDALSFRIVSQPEVGGTVAFDGTTATFLPTSGYLGTTSFAYAAWDGDIDSNLGTVTVTVSDPACPGRAEAYGFGCPGTDDILPTLSVTGCPTPGEILTVELANALGGAEAYLLVGRQRAAEELPRGCVRRVGAIVKQLGPFALAGSGAGQGTLSFSKPIPARYLGSTLTVQGFVRDAMGASGFSSTNGVEIRIE